MASIARVSDSAATATLVAGFAVFALRRLSTCTILQSLHPRRTEIVTNHPERILLFLHAPTEHVSHTALPPLAFKDSSRRVPSPDAHAVASHGPLHQGGRAILDIRLLGTPVFERDGSLLVTDTRKAPALLAYLAVEGPTRRDTLAALLWPDSADALARATLRRTLSAIRTAAVESVVTADRDQVSLTHNVRSDTRAFEEALATAADHDHAGADVCADCIPLLQRAVDLYRGDFMAGFSLRGAPEYEDWVRVTAERCRLAAGSAYERLAAAHAAAGAYDHAIAAVNGWLVLDPLREPVYRRLMLLYAWAGDRAGSIDAYRRCVAVLEQELGVDPLEETTVLHEAILDDDLPPAPGTRRPVTVRPARPPAAPDDLIDRGTELVLLTSAAERGGAVARLVGDAWMGKTRLLDEVADRAGAAGRSVVRARGYRAESALAYGVVRQLLESLTASPPWESGARGPSWALAEAARILPSLGEPSHGWHDDPLGEMRLLNALREMFTQVPVLILVDDAQWADDASVVFLTYLVNRIAASPATLVVAHRHPEDAAPLHSLTAAASSAGATVVTLGPLGAADLAPHAADPERAASIVARTGGIPALVAEALSGGSETPVTPGIRRLMEVRLAGVDDLCRQVMSAAAVLHGHCDVDLLQATCGRDDEELATAVESLQARGVLAAIGEGRVGFPLDGMEQLVYEEISMVRRRLLHRRAAAVLAVGGRDTDAAAAAAEIAQHHQAGGQEREAGEWWLRAGDLARQVFAAAEALEAYGTALALGYPDVTRIHLAMGDVLMLGGRYSEARAALEKAAGRSDGAEHALAEHRIGEIDRRLGRLEAAVAHFEAARLDHPEPVSLYGDWALVLLRGGDRDAALEAAQRAVDSTAGAGARQRSRALAVLGMTTPDRADAERALREALDLAGDDPILRMGALNALAENVASAGHDDEAVHLVNEALAIAGHIGDRHRQGSLYDRLADLHHRAGRRDQAEAALTEAVKLLVEIEPGTWEPEVWLLTRW